MLERIERFMIRRFCSKPGPLSYLVMLWSFAIGLFFALFWSLGEVKHTSIYQDSVLGSPKLWGILLTAGSFVVIVGMVRKLNAAIRAGTMVNFVMWFFAALLFFQHNLWYAFSTVAVFHLLVQAHFYLAASFDTLFPKR